jgi:hypothetical protein
MRPNDPACEVDEQAVRLLHAEERDEGRERGRAGDEAGPPVDGLGEAEAELERDGEQDRQHCEALLVEQLLGLCPFRSGHRQAGWSVPAKTCQASRDFAVKLSSM